MTPFRRWIGYHQDYHKLTAFDVIKPAGKQTSRGKAGVYADLVGVRQRLGEVAEVFGEQIWVFRIDVLFPFVTQFYFCMQVGTRESLHAN